MKYLMNPLMKVMSYHLQKRGILTIYWVCNYDNDFARAMKLGANGIMTDNPATLNDYLKEHYKNPEVEHVKVSISDQDK